MDWDLEAPGLHRFFSGYLPSKRSAEKGLIQLLRDASSSPGASWVGHLEVVTLGDEGSTISLLLSGDQAVDYSDLVQRFSWNQFFEVHQGGPILERRREEWKSEFDYILVDSRTGIADIGGVCTALLPDILALVFTANEQSFEGALEVAKGVSTKRPAGMPLMQLGSTGTLRSYSRREAGFKRLRTFSGKRSRY